MNLQLIDRYKRAIVLVSILSVIVGTYVGVKSHNENASQLAFIQTEQETKAKAEQEAKAKAAQVAKTSSSKAVSTSLAKTQIVEPKGFKNSIFANTSQIFLVTANSMSTSYGTGSMYEKTNGVWKKLSEFAVRLGAMVCPILQYKILIKRQQEY